MTKIFHFILISLFSFLLLQCTVVRPGQLAIKQKLGKLKGSAKSEGVFYYNPFTTKYIKTSGLSNNLLLELRLPSKEGLSVNASISILYKVEKEKLAELINSYSLDFEPIITAVFRSASSDVCAQFFAKDMHSGKRANIEAEILKKMTNTLNGTGLEIQAVLMKSINLPDGLANSIEQKLQAEQNAMRMEFILIQEKSEAERKIIEATGTRDAQLIQMEGLTPEILELKSIEAFEKLSNSSNAKIIITDGKAPFLIDSE